MLGRCARQIARQPSSLVITRGLKTNVSDLRKGDWIEVGDKISVINSITSTHSGRGARTFVMTLKDTRTDSISTLRPTAREAFQSTQPIFHAINHLEMEMSDVPYQFLYEADDNLFLLNPKTLEEIQVPKSFLSEKLSKVLEGGHEVKVRMHEKNPIFVHGGKNFKCRVAKILESREGTDRRQTVVLIEGGARIVTNTKLAIGDVININTDDLTYTGKA